MAQMLQITALYAGIFALIYIGLSARVALTRRRVRVSVFDGGNAELGRAIRQHGNFGEYVPFALILMALIELNGGAVWLVHGLGASLLVARLVYLNALKGITGATFTCRIIGMTLTWLVITVAALVALAQVLMR